MVVSDEIIEKIEGLSTFRLAILGLAHIAVVSMFWNHRWKMEKKADLGVNPRLMTMETDGQLLSK